MPSILSDVAAGKKELLEKGREKKKVRAVEKRDEEKLKVKVLSVKPKCKISKFVSCDSLLVYSCS